MQFEWNISIHGFLLRSSLLGRLSTYRIYNLRSLKLMGSWLSIHAISYLLKVDHGAPVLLEMQPTQFCDLRCLKMETLLSKDCIYAMAYFLKILPKLETFPSRYSFPAIKCIHTGIRQL